MQAKKSNSTGTTATASKTESTGPSKREETIQAQKDRYIAKSKRQPKGWSFKQFGKRTKAWQKMSEAGKK